MNSTIQEETWTADDEPRMPDGTVERAEETVRRLCLAGLGAAATVYDTAEHQFDQFVERGERVQEEIEAEMRERRLGRRIQRSRLGYAFRNAMDAFLDGLNVPNKSDVDTINVKLNILTRKIDELQLDRVRPAGAPATAETVPAVGSSPPAPDDPLPPTPADKT